MTSTSTASSAFAQSTTMLSPPREPPQRSVDDRDSANAMPVSPTKKQHQQQLQQQTDTMFFLRCLGSRTFAQRMSASPDSTSPAHFDTALKQAEHLIMNELTTADILEAAQFLGEFGIPKENMGSSDAAPEFLGLQYPDETVRQQLLQVGEQYRAKHGIKFIYSLDTNASADDALAEMQARLANDSDIEWRNARRALFDIFSRRFAHSGLPDFSTVLRKTVDSKQYGVQASSLAVSINNRTTPYMVGSEPKDLWEVASLSKSVGTAFAFEYFGKHGIDMTTTKVNDLLARLGSDFRVRIAEDTLGQILETGAAVVPETGIPLTAEQLQRTWIDEELTLEHLCSHAGLNMHYVKGVPANRPGGMLSTREYLYGNEYNPIPVRLIFRPGTAFKYSGAGFILIQHLIELHSNQKIGDVTRQFLDELGMPDFHFEVNTIPGQSYVNGQKDDGTIVEGGRKMFPAFAAGGMSTIRAMQHFCVMLGVAYHDEHGAGSISHATARRMLEPHDRDFAFMGCHIGVGIFVLLSVDNNRFMLHQGANDGFRVLCFHCYDGMDKGKGFTICSTGDEHAVLFNVAVAREVVRTLRFRGVRDDSFGALPDLRTEGLKQEEIVNIGYRDNLLHAFKPDKFGEETLRTETKATARSFIKESNILRGANKSVSNEKQDIETNATSAAAVEQQQQQSSPTLAPTTAGAAAAAATARTSVSPIDVSAPAVGAGGVGGARKAAVTLFKPSPILAPQQQPAGSFHGDPMTVSPLLSGGATDAFDSALGSGGAAVAAAGTSGGLSAAETIEKLTLNPPVLSSDAAAAAVAAVQQRRMSNNNTPTGPISGLTTSGLPATTGAASAAAASLTQYTPMLAARSTNSPFLEAAAAVTAVVAQTAAVANHNRKDIIQNTINEAPQPVDIKSVVAGAAGAETGAKFEPLEALDKGQKHNIPEMLPGTADSTIVSEDAPQVSAQQV